MNINSRLVTFGYDAKKKIFFMKTTDPEYLKILLAEEPIPEEILFELPEGTVKQMNVYYNLWKTNQIDKQPKEQLS